MDALLEHLRPYLSPIVTGCMAFPVVAALITVPFLIINYRRYGGIALMRVMVVYSMVLYSMCAFLLIILPLPSREAVAAMEAKPVNWVPFNALRVGLKKAGFSLQELSTWLDGQRWRVFLTSSDLFQILANVLMQIPLGFYLRYYFRCSWWQTLLLGLGVSLFYELTQLSGLFFLYPKPYRCADVDDLITNTLGAMVGYCLTPLAQLVLPTREEIDRISYDKGHRITLLRRLLAMALDWLLVGVAATVASRCFHHPDRGWMSAFSGWMLVLSLVYFLLLQRWCHGQTAGKALLKIRVVQLDGHTPPTLGQLTIRFTFIYLLTPAMLVVNIVALLLLVQMMATTDLTLWVLLPCAGVLVGTLCFLLRSFRKWGMLPHGHYSRTTIVTTGCTGHGGGQR